MYLYSPKLLQGPTLKSPTHKSQTVGRQTKQSASSNLKAVLTYAHSHKAKVVQAVKVSIFNNPVEVEFA
jgi:archaellin